MDTAVPSRATERTPVLLVGTVVWLASEVMFFGGLFAAYFTLRASEGGAFARGVELETAVAGAFTAVLVASSVTMHLGVQALAADDRHGYRRRLLVTAALAALFLANQAREWATADFGPDSHVYGSLFFVMTGFHGLHVLAGVLGMAVMVGRAAGPGLGARQLPAAEVLSYYWHFVDVVWLVMFSTVFFVR